MTERGVIEPIQRLAGHRFACGFRCEKIHAGHSRYRTRECWES